MGETALRTARYPVLGVPVDFVADGPEIATALDRCFGYWSGLDPRDVAAETAGRVTLRLRHGVEAAMVSDVVYDVAGPRSLALRVGASSGWVDADRRVAEADLTESLLSREETLCVGVLHALVLVLVTACGRRPLHAAMIVPPGEGAVLLAGRSGAGKSTLAYAALRRGWEVWTDDTVFLEPGPDPAIWTGRFRLRLDPATAGFFPEVAELPTQRMPNGKERVVVEPPARTPAPYRGPVTLCWLDSERGDDLVTPMAGEALVSHLSRRLEPGFDLDPEGAAAAAGMLARGGGWRLARPRHPDQAITALEAALGGA